MAVLRIRTTQLAIGLFCAVMGALMFVAPHQFNNPSFAALRPQMPWWGMAFLVAGSSLIGVMAFPVTRLASITSHLATGSMLILLAAGLAATGAWGGTTNYVVLGLGAASAPFLAARQEQQSAPWEGDLFGFILGLAGLVTGLYMLLLPGQFAQPLFDHIRPWLLWYGLAFVASGLALATVQVRALTPPWLAWLAHAAFALVFYLYVFNLTYPAWTAIGLYVGFGTLVLVLPWISPRLQRLDPACLPMRLALVVAVIAAVPLLIVVSLLAYEDEQQSTLQALHLQEMLAGVIARDVASYVGEHQRALEVLAEQLTVAGTNLDSQPTQVTAFHAAYPELLVVATYDRLGNELARSGPALPGLALPASPLQPINATLLRVDFAVQHNTPFILFYVPLRDTAGQVAGVVVGGIEALRLTAYLDQADIVANTGWYLLDEQGRMIAATGRQPLPQRPPISTWLPFRVFTNSVGTPGATRYGSGPHDRLVGYTRVPGINWDVIAEVPAAVALASVTQSRDLAFIVLLVVLAAALGVGIVAARDLTTTLAALVQAVNCFDGEDELPLPQSTLSEVASLAAAFASLRHRLATRTTERDQAEVALRASEERYRTIVETAQEGIWLLDDQGCTSFVNRAMATMLGYTVETMLGQPFSAFLDKTNPVAAITSLQGEQVGITQWHDFPLRHKNGSTLWTIVFVHTIPDPSGASTEVLATVVNITERKQAEDMLRFLAECSTALTASLDYTATVASIMRLIVPRLADWCVIDLLDEEGTLHQVGVTHIEPAKEELIREIRRRYPPNPDLAEPHVLWRTLRTGQSELCPDIAASALASLPSDPDHLALRQAVGVTSYIIVPLRARERTLGAISLVTGQSGRRYGREELVLAEELAGRAALALDNARLYQQAQEAVQIRDQFLSVASHELKTPLTALIGYVKILQRRLLPDSALTERDLRALRVIDKQANRLHRLITLMLDLSRIQRGQLQIERQYLNLTALVQRVVQELTVSFEQHRFRLVLPNEPLIVVGDEGRLEQVLHNLVQNAVKYSPAGGTIEVGVGEQDDCACMWVTDEGVGIPPEAVPQLFQRFQRIVSPDTSHVSGLGLGLYIVKEIVTQHGGTIEVMSTAGKGSTFTVWLPFTVAVASAR